MKRVAIVSTEGGGGVKTTIRKLHEGLTLVGHHTDLFIVGSNTFSLNGLATLKIDVKLFGKLENYDTVLYMNSVPLPDSFLLAGPRRGLFVHGYVNSELMYDIKDGFALTKLRAAFLLSYRRIATRFPEPPDYCIYRCESAREADNVKCASILLPEFVLPREVLSFLGNPSPPLIREKRKPRIVAYLQPVDSPRTLQLQHIIKLATILQSEVRGGVEFTIINFKSFGNVNRDIKLVKFMPRNAFLEFLRSSDLYLERLADEELGNISIDAGLLGVPVAKLTLSRYLSKCDYRRDEVLQGSSLTELSSVLANYFNNKSMTAEALVSNYRSFLLSKRSWKAASRNLVGKIES